MDAWISININGSPFCIDIMYIGCCRIIVWKKEKQE